MKTHLGFLIAFILVAGTSQAADWVTAPSYFTHDPATGERVTQFQEIPPVYAHVDPTYVRSGYHHTRSSIRVGQTADHYHVVEEWGRPVRPYGEWLFPYRPYSVPYHLWGPPFAGLQIVPFPHGHKAIPGGDVDAPHQPYDPDRPGTEF